MTNHEAPDKIREAVKEHYGEIARQAAASPAKVSCCGPSQSGCCAPAPAVREAPNAAGLFYNPEELARMPQGAADASLGCGNPTAIADLKPGEVVLDLGSGGGIDCFLAANAVGAGGRVIGLDMTPAMIRLAGENARQAGYGNIEFRLGEIEDMPLPDAAVDVIISNCVINLSPDKDAVFREAYRVLRPGGRMSISDMVVSRELPPPIRGRLDAWASCIAGALPEADYLAKIAAAGFQGVTVNSRDYMAVVPDGAGPAETVAAIAEALGMPAVDVKRIMHDEGISAGDLRDLVASIRVSARKPA